MTNKQVKIWLTKQEKISIIKNYAPDIRALTYTKQILVNLKEKIDCKTIIFENLTSHRSSRQEIIKETSMLNSTLDKIT